MKLGIMQPYFLPYIGYWQLMNAVDHYVIYEDVNFIKGGWINRNRLLLQNEPKFFNIQMEGASPNKHINEVRLLKNRKMIEKTLKMFDAAYKKAPQYLSVMPLIERIFLHEEENLAKFLINSIYEMAEFLEMDTKFHVSSNIEKNNELRGQEKVIAICKKLNADEYYNAIGGQKLYDRNEFKQQGISLKFLSTNEIVYKQYNDEFVASLSIADVLMFNEKEKVKKMLKDFTLI